MEGDFAATLSFTFALSFKQLQGAVFSSQHRYKDQRNNLDIGHKICSFGGVFHQ